MISRLHRVALPLALLSSSFTLPAIADDWHTGAGGDSSRTSRSAEVGPHSPNLLWSGGLSAIVSQQAVVGDDLVVMPRIQNFNIPTGTWIVAHELLTGAIRWQIRLPFNDPMEWRSKVTAIRDGVVYATRSGGEVNPAALFALDPADGSLAWMSEDLIEERTTETLAFAANGDPIVGNFTSVARIDRTDGTTIWSVPRSTPTSNGAQVAVRDNRGYIWEPSPGGPVITALDIENGVKLHSSAAVAGGFIQQLSLFVGPDGTVYAPRSQNNPVTDFLVAYDDTGSSFVEKWRTSIGYIPFGTHAVGPDGTIYGYRTVRMDSEVDLTLIRLDPASGMILHESDPIRGDFPSSPRIAVDAAGTLFFTNGGFPNGKLVSLDADLTIRWSTSIQNVNLGGPTLGPGGVLVVCGIGTDVRAYRTNDRLALNAPEPGVAGAMNTVRLRGATPGARVLLGFGRVSGSTPVPPCPGVSLGIGDVRVGAAVTADGNGEVSLSAPVPAALSGATFFVQALERATCRISNRVEITFQ